MNFLNFNIFYFLNNIKKDLSGTTCSNCLTTLCKTCFGTLTNCTSCDYTKNLWLNGNTCTSLCPSGKYKNNVTSTCTVCDSSCLACNNSGFTGCTSCSTGKYLY